MKTDAILAQLHSALVLVWLARKLLSTEASHNFVILIFIYYMQVLADRSKARCEQLGEFWKCPHGHEHNRLNIDTTTGGAFGIRSPQNTLNPKIHLD